MLVSSPCHVLISVYDKNMTFGITYKPDTEFMLVSDLNLNSYQLKTLASTNWSYENLKLTDSLEVYTGKLRLHGIFFMGNSKSSFEAQVARTLLISMEEDSRFAHLENKVIELVPREEYDMWNDFDSATRLIPKEKKLFDITIALFRATTLNSMIKELEFLKNLRDHKQFEWKELYSLDNNSDDNSDLV